MEEKEVNRLVKDYLEHLEESELVTLLMTHMSKDAKESLAVEILDYTS